MHTRSFLVFSCTASLVLLACCCSAPSPVTDRVGDHLQVIRREFAVDTIAYIVADAHSVIEYESTAAPAGISPQQCRDILTGLSAPVLLSSMIKASLVPAEQPLWPWVSGLHDGSLQVKDLLAVPARHQQPDLTDPDRLLAMTLCVIDTMVHRHPTLQGNFPNRQFMAERDTTPIAVLRAALTISRDLDRFNPEYLSPGGDIDDLVPAWYVENVTRFFGWQVLKWQQQTILWACFRHDRRTTLLMKSMKDGVFVAASYVSRNLASPLDRGHHDLLRSSLALSVLQALLPDYPSVDFRKIVDSQGATMPAMPKAYQWLFLNDMLVHADLSKLRGDDAGAGVLYTCYRTLAKDSLLPDYRTHPLVASVDYVGNRVDASVPFELTRDTPLRIFAGGQQMIERGKDHAHNYDNIQLSFHAPRKARREKADNFHFNLNYFNMLSGSTYSDDPDYWITNNLVQYKHHHPTDTTYFLEIAIAWKALMDQPPVAGQQIPLNVFSGDSDVEENWRKSILSWAVENGSDWNDVSKFGKLTLARGVSRKSAPREVLSSYAVQEPAIDGTPEALWQQVPYTPLSVLYEGGLTSPRDHAAAFKMLWNKEYLYVLVRVTDNWKNKMGLVTRDKCWIERPNGDLVWKMNVHPEQDAPSFTTSQAVRLSRGSYVLRYTSDDRNSYDGWYGDPPANGLYGARLYIDPVKTSR